MRFLRGEEKEEEEAGCNLLELFGTIGIRSVRYDRLIMHLGRCAGNRGGEGEGSVVDNARRKEQRFRQEWEYKFRLRLDRFRIGFQEIRRYEHRFRIVSIYV